MSRGLDAVFYEFSGIIILGFLTNQNTRTNNGDLFTCNDFNVWVENVYWWRALIINAMIPGGYDFIFRSQSASKETFIHVA